MWHMTTTPNEAKDATAWKPSHAVRLRSCARGWGNIRFWDEGFTLEQL